MKKGLGRGLDALFSIYQEDEQVKPQQQVKEEVAVATPVSDGVRELDIKLVATNDAHYVEKSDARTQSVLMCIQTATTLADGKMKGFETEEFYLKSEDEMRLLFPDCKSAIDNTVEIADKCNFEFVFEQPKLPTYATPQGKSADVYLR